MPLRTPRGAARARFARLHRSGPRRI